MKRLVKVALAVSFMAIMASCNTIQMQKVLPYYTEPGKLAMLKNGMTLSQINSTLGVDPYDVYHIQDDGSSVLVYSYRLKKRRIEYKSAEDLATEESQTAGDVWYDEEHQAYLLLNDGKLTSFITDSGRADSKAVLVTNNLLQLISEKELIEWQEAHGLWDEDAEEQVSGRGADQQGLVIPLDKLNINSIDAIDLKLK